ncbi:MAG: hypothetical protein JOZ02_03330 [Acidobacteria bacterium]|nr:hypothetical protein [Acidobacteriota bacterium]
MKRTALLCVLLTTCLCGGAPGADKTGRGTRSVVGIVYFTNNSPEDYSFLVELFEGRAKRRVAAKWTDGRSGNFEFKGLRPGVYYVQVSGPNICLLQYEVDASKGQPERLQVFGDADCGHNKPLGLPAPRRVPRTNKR